MPRLTVVTQNVDDLHERARSRDVIHLHGSLHSPRCIDCGQPYTLPPTSEALPEGGMSRHDAVHVMGMFDLKSFGLVRCCPKMYGALG